MGAFDSVDAGLTRGLRSHPTPRVTVPVRSLMVIPVHDAAFRVTSDKKTIELVFRE